MAQGLKAQEEKNGQAQQLQQQVQQLEQQLQEMQQALQEAQGAVDQAEQAKMQQEQQMAQANLELDWYKARNDKDYKEKELEAKDRLLQAEVMQLYDGNKQNDEIKNVV